jgi:hypothetical protein
VEQIFNLVILQSHLNLHLWVLALACVRDGLLRHLGLIVRQPLQYLVVGISTALCDILILLDPLPLSVDPHVLHIR